jgi:hypothetical protein
VKLNESSVDRAHGPRQHLLVKRLLTLVAAVPLVLPAAAHAAVTVTFGPTTTVRMDGAGDVATLSREGTMLRVQGTATPQTDQSWPADGIIKVSVSIRTAQGTTTVLDLRGGDLGMPVEFAGDPAGVDQAQIISGAASRAVRMGSQGINLDGGTVPDVTLGGMDRVSYTGDAGVDDVRANGGVAVGSDPLTIPVKLDGGAGNDILVGGAAGDELRGGPGDDYIDARDGASDVVDCGGNATGTDTVEADAVDKISACDPAGPAPPTRPEPPAPPGPAPDPPAQPVSPSSPPAQPPRSTPGRAVVALAFGEVRLLRVKGTGTLVPVRCAQTASGFCRGRLEIRPRRGTRALGRASFSLLPGQRIRLRVELTSAALISLKRTGALRATLVVTVRDRNGPAPRRVIATTVRRK